MFWLFLVSALIIILVLVASVVVINKGYAYKGNKDDIEIDYEAINRRILEETKNKTD